MTYINYPSWGSSLIISSVGVLSRRIWAKYLKRKEYYIRFNTACRFHLIVQGRKGWSTSYVRKSPCLTDTLTPNSVCGNTSLLWVHLSPVRIKRQCPWSERVLTARNASSQLAWGRGWAEHRGYLPASGRISKISGSPFSERNHTRDS